MIIPTVYAILAVAKKDIIVKLTQNENPVAATTGFSPLFTVEYPFRLIVAVTSV